ncbi:MAG: hypothetical protein KCHDKBKB_02676 [Elusimicrobia bacterium]|nr:hypothetical protein [Elusimicrobiota bacterium]
MNTSFSHALFLFLALSLTVIGFAGDEALRSALEQANKGEVESAITELKKISEKNPGDARVHQSLGFLYQTNDQVNEAIQELEKAVSISPSPEALYSLGLLYESKWLSSNDNSWKSKAHSSWGRFLKEAPPNHPRRSIAEKHLNKLNQN